MGIPPFYAKTGVKVDSGRELALDLTDTPQFKSSSASLGEMLGFLPLDIAILTALTMLAFAGALIAFLRYDVR